MANIVYRSVKGSPLTNAEMDGNLSLLEKYAHGTFTHTGSINYELSSTEADNYVLKFTGTLTTNITVSLPASLVKDWLIYNNTVGGYIIYVKVVGGGVTVACYNGSWRGIVSDGTNTYATSVEPFASTTLFHENDITINSNQTLTSGKNAMSAGPITIANGVTINIPNGSTWTVV